MINVNISLAKVMGEMIKRTMNDMWTIDDIVSQVILALQGHRDGRIRDDSLYMTSYAQAPYKGEASEDLWFQVNSQVATWEGACEKLVGELVCEWLDKCIEDEEYHKVDANKATHQVMSENLYRKSALDILS